MSIPTARATFIGEGLRAFIEAATSAVEGAVKAKAAEVTATPLRACRSPSPSMRDLADGLAHALKWDLPGRWTRVEAGREPVDRVFRYIARHECGAWCVVMVTEAAILDADRAHRWDDVRNRFACYCVPRG